MWISLLWQLMLSVMVNDGTAVLSKIKFHNTDPCNNQTGLIVTDKDSDTPKMMKTNLKV